MKYSLCRVTTPDPSKINSCQHCDNAIIVCSPTLPPHLPLESKTSYCALSKQSISQINDIIYAIYKQFTHRLQFHVGLLYCPHPTRVMCLWSDRIFTNTIKHVEITQWSHHPCVTHLRGKQVDNKRESIIINHNNGVL